MLEESSSCDRDGRHPKAARQEGGVDLGTRRPVPASPLEQVDSLTNTIERNPQISQRGHAVEPNLDCGSRGPQGIRRFDDCDVLALGMEAPRESKAANSASDHYHP